MSSLEMDDVSGGLRDEQLDIIIEHITNESQQKMSHYALTTREAMNLWQRYADIQKRDEENEIVLKTEQITKIKRAENTIEKLKRQLFSPIFAVDEEEKVSSVHCKYDYVVVPILCDSKTHVFETSFAENKMKHWCLIILDFRLYNNQNYIQMEFYDSLKEEEIFYFRPWRKIILDWLMESLEIPSFYEKFFRLSKKDHLNSCMTQLESKSKEFYCDKTTTSSSRVNDDATNIIDLDLVSDDTTTTSMNRENDNDTKQNIVLTIDSDTESMTSDVNNDSSSEEDEEMKKHLKYFSPKSKYHHHHQPNKHTHTTIYSLNYNYCGTGGGSDGGGGGGGDSHLPERVNPKESSYSSLSLQPTITKKRKYEDVSSEINDTLDLENNIPTEVIENVNKRKKIRDDTDDHSDLIDRNYQDKNHCPTKRKTNENTKRSLNIKYKRLNYERKHQSHSSLNCGFFVCLYLQLRINGMEMNEIDCHDYCSEHYVDDKYKPNMIQDILKKSSLK